MMGTIVKLDWQNTAEGKTIMQHFYNPQNNGRKLFGILERPLLPNVEEVSYKLFFVGKSGTGKSATIARLAGAPEINEEYIETRGIRKTNIYWPAKVWDRTILFRLQCWDTGDRDLKKFGHILPACTEETDAIIFIFSFNDPSGLDNISTNLPTFMNHKSNPAPIVIGTKYCPGDFTAKVTVSDIEEFEATQKINILKINKTVGNYDQNEIDLTYFTLNVICEQLWIRDQNYILSQEINSSQIV
ncbi:ciliogenesis and planar polarity effector 2-like [Daktulosphaira vitifoliae]|uniref:ciliogenesis and planar polarity effector 2-like n=1 Tax=Daktulosphaira vitifoliae TaxID=58002 RepID=UPI0021AA9874|nr:ciliogenesis and planar polarity effector 2-like [Daktulosphaira vitifoliae]